MTPEDQAQKLAEIMSEMNQEFVPVEDFVESFKFLSQIIVDNKLASDSDRETLLGEINDVLNKIVLESKARVLERSQFNQALKTAVLELETLVHDISLTPGEKGNDGPPGPPGRKGDDGRDGSPDSAEDVRNKLELLEGEERFDAKYIKNLPKVDEKRLKEIENLVRNTAMPVTTNFFNGLRAKNLVIEGSTAVQRGDTVYVTPPGASSGVQSVVAGTGISVDNTDPQNPIVSATGSSTSFVDNEVVSGSATSFTLANTPVVGSVHLYAVGQRLTPTVDYAISGTGITTVMSWLAGNLLADYRTP